MATNEHVTDWTSTASCTPAGTDTIGTSLDDELRMIKATIYSTSRIRVQAKSADYTSTVSDHATLLAVTPSAATLSVSLAAAATMQDGGWLAIANNDTTFPVLIDPNGSETLGGTTIYSLYPSQRIVVASNDVDGWHVVASHRPSRVVNVNADHTASEDFVLASAGASTLTVTLVAANMLPDNRITVKKKDSGAGMVKVQPPSGTIDGASSTNLTGQYQRTTVMSDGTAWWTV